MREAVRKLSARNALAGLLLLTACDVGRDEPDEMHVAAAVQFVPEEVARVGSIDDPEAGFSRIGGVAVDDTGAVYVLESQDRQIRVYDERGAYLRSFGRVGSGPGEFKNATLIGLRHDTLAVGDVNLGRVTLFSPTGQVLETLPMPPVWLEVAPSVMVMVEPVRLRNEGFLAKVTRILTPPQPPPQDSFGIPQVAMDRGGRVIDTLRLEPFKLNDRRIKVGTLEVRVPAAPAATPLFVDGDGDTFVVERPVAPSADQGTITVTRLGQSGDTLYRSEVRYRPSVFPSWFVDTTVTRTVRGYLRNPQADSTAIDNAVRRALQFPPYQPPIVQGRVGADGVLWLQLQDEVVDWKSWLLLDADGRIKGVVTLPASATIHWSSGDCAWAAVRDDNDVPWLVRYRLRPRAP